MSPTRVQNLSISVDGFGTGEGLSRDGPLGHAGERLHEWMFSATVRSFLAAGLVDHMHVVVVPILLGRGERLWDGLEALEETYEIESVSSPSGVVHMTFTRAVDAR